MRLLLTHRMPFAAVHQLEPLAKGAIAVATSALTKMKANCADAPYGFEKGPGGKFSCGHPLSQPICTNISRQSTSMNLHNFPSDLSKHALQAQ